MRKTTEDHQKEDGNCAQHHSSITLLHGKPQPLLVLAEYINGYCYVYRDFDHNDIDVDGAI